METFETDILIVGSGSGGGVAAATLAQQGFKVLVVEQGNYTPVDELKGNQAEGFGKLYMGQGIVVTEEGTMSVLAAKTFGGGSFSEASFHVSFRTGRDIDFCRGCSLVNWSASLLPPPFLREAWAKEYGLPYFLSSEFDESVKHV